MAKSGRKIRGKAGYMISAVAEMYNLHPQTLRLYEREGLLTPSRSEGNTRLYTEEDLEQLDVILKLTRDLGVNLAGIEIILNMRKRMAEMEREMKAFVEYARSEFLNRAQRADPRDRNALIRVGSAFPGPRR
ncbi:MAG: helix-turn-helix transcriptional regulator [Acidobacteriota bacterium]|nr:helix-turn-helix transcriptional regulator [Acidobacteriota bacterium]